MNYLTKAGQTERYALADGFFDGLIKRFRIGKPLAAVNGIIKYLRGIKLVNTVFTVVSAVIVYARSYAVLLALTGILSVLVPAATLLLLPPFAVSLLFSLRKCRRDFLIITESQSDVCFVFMHKKQYESRFFRSSLDILSDGRRVYAVGSGIFPSPKKHSECIDVQTVDAVFYHRLKRKLQKSGYSGRMTVII